MYPICLEKGYPITRVSNEAAMDWLNSHVGQVVYLELVAGVYYLRGTIKGMHGVGLIIHTASGYHKISRRHIDETLVAEPGIPFEEEVDRRKSNGKSR